MRRLDCLRLLVEIEMLKSLLVRAQKNHHRGYLKCCKQTVNRNLDLRTVPMRMQKEMRNMLLEIGGKWILVA